MPRGDRTGPLGYGPMTGRAMGHCSGNPVPGFMYPAPRFGFGRGYGFARPFGFGRGRGRCRFWSWTSRNYSHPSMMPDRYPFPYTY
jgi:hypothetical protein